MEQVWVKAECWTAGCHFPTSHIMESRVMRYATSEDPMEPYVQKVGYCHWDAREMAIALISNYDHEYEILDIRPVNDEDFPDEGIYEFN